MPDFSPIEDSICRRICSQQHETVVNQSVLLCESWLSTHAPSRELEPLAQEITDVGCALQVNIDKTLRLEQKCDLLAT